MGTLVSLKADSSEKSILLAGGGDSSVLPRDQNGILGVAVCVLGLCCLELPARCLCGVVPLVVVTRRSEAS